MVSASLMSSWVKPPASCVDKVTLTVLYTLDHSGWWSSFSATNADGHKAERLVEVLEYECTGDGVAAFDFMPALKPGERGFACFAGKFLCHLSPPISLALHPRSAAHP